MFHVFIGIQLLKIRNKPRTTLHRKCYLRKEETKERREGKERKKQTEEVCEEKEVISNTNRTAGVRRL